MQIPKRAIGFRDGDVTIISRNRLLGSAVTENAPLSYVIRGYQVNTRKVLERELAEVSYIARIPDSLPFVKHIRSFCILPSQYHRVVRIVGFNEELGAILHMGVLFHAPSQVHISDYGIVGPLIRSMESLGYFPFDLTDRYVKVLVD